MKAKTKSWVAVVVVLVLTALAAYLFIEFRRVSELEKQVFSKLTLQQTAVAIREFYLDAGRWPETLDALQSNERGIIYVTSSRGFNKDGWGRNMVYQHFDPVLGYGAVSSYGADGRPGGIGSSADLEVRFGVNFPGIEGVQTNTPKSARTSAGKKLTEP